MGKTTVAWKMTEWMHIHIKNKFIPHVNSLKIIKELNTNIKLWQSLSIMYGNCSEPCVLIWLRSTPKWRSVKIMCETDLNNISYIYLWNILTKDMEFFKIFSFKDHCLKYWINYSVEQWSRTIILFIFIYLFLNCNYIILSDDAMPSKCTS